MTAVARVALLDLRTIAPYRRHGLLLLVVVTVILANRPTTLVPALVLLVAPSVISYPFSIADKAGLDTLYAVLPLRRRSVVPGHYAWAVSAFLALAAGGTAVALALAHAESKPLGGHALGIVLAVAWGMVAVNVAVQFPLFIRFGYTRISVLGTVPPLALVVIAVVRLRVPVAGIESWVPLLWPIGAALIAVSVAVSVVLDRRPVQIR
nr:hypothetical protein GCM10020063_005120 [Dactylosporangium thailandense]